MRSLVLAMAVAAILAGCQDHARVAEDRANKAIAQVAALEGMVADLQMEVSDLGDALDDARGADTGSPVPDDDEQRRI